MSSPRLRRLQRDYERIFSRFAGWPLIQIELADGMPPDMYRIWFNIKGLHTAPDGRILEREEHVLEIKLGLEYPRRAPQLRLLTPLFHPNCNMTEVCAQDIYAASEGLDDLIIRIGRMIAYQDYNTKSPLNGIAAKWAAENSHRLPVDGREIAPSFADSYDDPQPPPITPPASMPEKDQWENHIVIGEEEVMTASNNIVTDPIEFKCPLCEAGLRSPADHIGKIVQCPSCEGAITVPSPALPTNAENGSIKFTCPYCKQPLEADSEMAGEEIPCPSCKKPIIVDA